MTDLPPPPKVMDLLEGTLPKTIGRYAIVTNVKQFEGPLPYATSGWLITYLDLQTRRSYKAWWTEMWLDWGVVEYDT